MKTFIYHDPSDSQGRQRVETKSPTVQTLGEEPRNEYQRVALAPNQMAAEWNPNRDYTMTETFVRYEMIFETVRFSTMKWVEDYHEGRQSYGHYARIDSFCSIPEGARIDGAMKYEQGTDIYGYLNTVPLRGSSQHRVTEKIRELEEQLAILSTRPILSEEQLKQMRANYLDSRDHHESIPQRLKEYDYFENDNDFRME